MPMLEIPDMGITITVDRSSASDRVPVVFIDTDERLGEEGPLGPKIRVHVNDGEVFHGVDRGDEPEDFDASSIEADPMSAQRHLDADLHYYGKTS